jgi:predicted GNAT family acetyltransferase
VLTASPARRLGSFDRPAIERVLERDPVVSAAVADKVRLPWRSDGALLGYGDRRQLEALCWVGANLLPVNASSAAVAAFAETLPIRPPACSSIVGPAATTLPLWERLRDCWGPAREVRGTQPLLVADRPPAVAADPAVRLVRPDEVDLLYPAAVAMYTEEVGSSPLTDGGGQGYRRRVVDLVRGGRAYTRIVGGEVVFKAELALVTRHTAQVQGVWVAPGWRGHGLGTAGMAAVVRDALRRVAPTVSLYVNDYNEPARRVYARCGFRQIDTFATVLL